MEALNREEMAKEMREYYGKQLDKVRETSNNLVAAMREKNDCLFKENRDLKEKQYSIDVLIQNAEVRFGHYEDTIRQKEVNFRWLQDKLDKSEQKLSEVTQNRDSLLKECRFYKNVRSLYEEQRKVMSPFQIMDLVTELNSLFDDLVNVIDETKLLNTIDRIKAELYCGKFSDKPGTENVEIPIDCTLFNRMISETMECRDSLSVLFQDLAVLQEDFICKREECDAAHARNDEMIKREREMGFDIRDLREDISALEQEQTRLKNANEELREQIKTHAEEFEKFKKEADRKERVAAGEIERLIQEKQTVVDRQKHFKDADEKQRKRIKELVEQLEKVKSECEGRIYQNTKLLEMNSALEKGLSNSRDENEIIEVQLDFYKSQSTDLREKTDMLKDKLAQSVKQIADAKAWAQAADAGGDTYQEILSILKAKNTELEKALVESRFQNDKLKKDLEAQNLKYHELLLEKASTRVLQVSVSPSTERMLLQDRRDDVSEKAGQAKASTPRGAQGKRRV